MASNQNSDINSSFSLIKHIKHHTYKWTIDDFANLLTKNLKTDNFGYKYVETQIFAHPHCGGVQFRLDLYPDGNQEIARNYVCVNLHLVSSVLKSNDAYFKISILNVNNEKCNVAKSKRPISFDESEAWGWAYIYRDQLLEPSNGLLSNGKLTLLIKIQVFGKEILNAKMQKRKEKEILLHNALSIGENHGKLFDSGELSDFTLVVEGKKLRVHKTILASRSPYFSAMFRQSSMKEAIENRFQIIEFSVEVMQDLLRYVYSGVYEPKEQNIADLFIAAHRYELEKLKDLCENSLCSLVTADTASDLLALTDLYSSEKLKTALVDHRNLQAQPNMDKVEVTNGKPKIAD